MKPNPIHRGDPTFIPELFKHFGIPLTIMPGAMQWGMGDFGYIQGIFWHHTGARNTSAAYIKNNPGLGGALSSLFHLSPAGHHTLCGIGIAYHAGRGSGHGWPANNANPRALGYEMQHNGTDAWPDDQLYWARRSTAAILWYLGHDATIDHFISHWEYSMIAQGKWDPGKGNGVAGAVMDMNPERARVQTYINNIRKYGQLDTPAESPQEEEETVLYEKLTKFITGYVSGFFKPWFGTWNETWEKTNEAWDQLRGPGGNGWPQLGKNHKGQNLTLVDAVAALRQDVARISKQLEEIKAGK